MEFALRSPMAKWSWCASMVMSAVGTVRMPQRSKARSTKV